MLVIDSARALYINAQKEAEKQLQRSEDFQKEVYSRSIYVNQDDTIAIASSEHQWGTPMDWQEMERRLRTLNCGPDLIFLDHFNRPFRGIYYKERKEGNKITCYGRAMLPEWSTCTLVPQVERDFGTKSLNRLDHPEVEWHGPKVLDYRNVQNTKNMGYKPKDPNTLLPGWKKTLHNYGENPDDIFARGWRTVCLHFILRRLATADEIEQKFARTDRLSWAHHTGRREMKGLPF